MNVLLTCVKGKLTPIKLPKGYALMLGTVIGKSGDLVLDLQSRTIVKLEEERVGTDCSWLYVLRKVPKATK